MDLAFSVAVSDAQFNRFENGGGPGVDYDGNDLPYAFEVTSFTGFDVNLPSTLGEFYLHLDYSHSDGYFSNANNAPTHEVDSYHTVNGLWDFAVTATALYCGVKISPTSLTFATAISRLPEFSAAFITNREPTAYR